MKEFNQQLHDDVVKLRKLRLKKDKSEYKKCFTVVQRRYKFSRTTLWAELRKEVPGQYRSISWELRYRPITDEEVKMVYELFYRRYTIEQIKTIMEERLGGNYSDTRMAKIRAEMEKRLPELETEDTSAFGGGINEIFSKFCDLELMHPDKKVNVNLLGKKYKVNSGIARDAVKMMIISAENNGKDNEELRRIRMENMLSKKIDTMYSSSQVSMTELRNAELLRKSFEKKSSAHLSKLTPDGRVLMELCRELRPDMTFIEIYEEAMKKIKSIKGTSEEIEPDHGPAMEECQRIIRNDPGSGWASESVLKKADEDGYWDMTEEAKNNWRRVQ